MDKEQRLQELRNTPRCGEDLSYSVDTTGGLIDLVEFVQPKKMLEIGSHKGVSTEVFLLYAEHVTVLDPWDESGREVYSDIPHNLDDPIYKQFMARCGGYENLTAIHGYSPGTLRMFDPASFDFIYIDGIHSKEGVKIDIEATLPLVSPGGWIGGHDYVIGDPINEVIPAVDEMFGKPDKVFADSSWIKRVP